MIIYNLQNDPVPTQVPDGCIHVYPEPDCVSVFHLEHWDAGCGEWVEDDTVSGWADTVSRAQWLETQYRALPHERLAMEIENLARKPDHETGTKLRVIAQKVREL